MSEAVLQVDSLCKTFRDKGGKVVKAVDSVSFSVGKGEVVGLLGPNGAGKTTTIKCILGVMRPNSGTVRVMGTDARAGYPGVLKHISAVLEGSRNLYWGLTVLENVRFFAGLHGISPAKGAADFRQLLETFGLMDKKDVEVRKLSQGMKQKTSVICALARRTPLVFLDEPTLGLDVETSLELRSTLRKYAREEGRTVIVSSHDMDVIQEICSRVIIMSNGKVVTDDCVSHLIDLFRTRACTVQLGVAAPDGLQAELISGFAPAEIVSAAGGDRGDQIRATLAEKDDIYRLVGLLHDRNLPIEEISYGRPDLEQVFLEIVRKERGQA